MAGEHLFSTPRERARLNRSGSDELSFDLSPIRSQVDDTIIGIDTDDAISRSRVTFWCFSRHLSPWMQLPGYRESVLEATFLLHNFTKLINKAYCTPQP